METAKVIPTPLITIIFADIYPPPGHISAIFALIYAIFSPQS